MRLFAKIIAMACVAWIEEKKVWYILFFLFRRFGRFSRMEISTIKTNPHNWFCCNFVSTIDTFWNITNTWNSKYNAVGLKLSCSRKHSRDSLPIDNKKKKHQHFGAFLTANIYQNKASSWSMTVIADFCHAIQYFTFYINILNIWYRSIKHRYILCTFM